MNNKAVVFDLDGTLLDTLEDIAESMNNVLQKRGFPIHPLGAYRNFIGDGARMLINRSLPAGERIEKIIAECSASFKEEYLRNWNKTTKPYDGIVKTLDELVKNKLKLAVLSNKPDIFTKMCVNEFLDSHKFQVVLGQRDDIPPKPDPTGAKLIADHLRIEPGHILYIGDSGVDMKTAIYAGMVPIGVLWGFRPKEELIKNGAKAVISSPQEIITHISTLKP